MQKHLAKGVTLTLIPTEKFKTVTIKLKFKADLKAEQITKRTLISNLLSTNSQHYPTQTDFRRALSNLYGARLSTSVTKKGTAHILSLDMTIVNDKYLKEEGTVEKSIDFIRSILFFPNVYNGGFHKETFEREIENLRDEYQAIYDDKEEYAAIALNDLYYETEEQKIPSWGRETDLLDITPENLYEAYTEMITEDELDIYVLGDIQEKTICEAFGQFNWEDREPRMKPVFYKQLDTNEIKNKKETQPVAQAKFNLAFKSGIFYHQEMYYAGQVFNGLFGGYPHSKLFMNVREKESLAYTISSGIDSFTGSLFVHSGIDYKEADRVEAIILQELKSIQTGQFSEGALDQTKSLLINSLHQSEDSASSIIERVYANKLVQSPQNSLDKWIESIQSVTKEEVMEAAKQVELIAKYQLSGEKK